jgi:hypothetical protein
MKIEAMYVENILIIFVIISVCYLSAEIFVIDATKIQKEDNVATIT